MERVGGSLTVIGGTLQTSGGGVAFGGYGGGANHYVSLTDVDIIAAAAGLSISSVNSAIEVNGGSINTQGALITSNRAALGEITLNNVQASHNGTAIAVSNSATLTVTTNRTNLSGLVTASGSATLNVNLADNELTGSLVSSDTASLIVSASSGRVTGDVTGSGSSTTNINLNNGTLLGNTDAQEEAAIIINGNNGTTITGDIIGSGSSHATVNLDNSTLTGDITAAGDAVLAVNLDHNSTLTGKVDPVDMAILNNSVWHMTADSQVNDLLVNSGGKVIFRKDAGFKTLTTRTLGGGGEFHMHTDLAANTGDLLEITGTAAARTACSSPTLARKPSAPNPRCRSSSPPPPARPSPARPPAASTTTPCKTARNSPPKARQAWSRPTGICTAPASPARWTRSSTPPPCWAATGTTRSTRCICAWATSAPNGRVAQAP
jgi:hypothetical protein